MAAALPAEIRAPRTHVRRSRNSLEKASPGSTRRHQERRFRRRRPRTVPPCARQSTSGVRYRGGTTSRRRRATSASRVREAPQFRLRPSIHGFL